MRARLRELLPLALSKSGPLAKSVAGHPALDAQLDRIQTSLVTLEREAELSVEIERVVELLAGVINESPSADAALASLAKLAVADLYLARACARGEAKAVRRFEAVCGPDLDRAIEKSPGLGLGADEFRQLVFLRLFVSEGATPAKILSYRGQGSLKAWVRVTAARLVIDLSRRRAEPANPGSDHALLERMGSDDDVELDYLRRSFGPQLEQAFAHAVAALSVRQRNLLRQRHLHEVSAENLAKLYAVHRSTIFVWLEQARVALLEHVQGALAQRVPEHRLESMVHMLGSKLQVSVRRLLDSQLEVDE